MITKNKLRKEARPCKKIFVMNPYGCLPEAAKVVEYEVLLPSTSEGVITCADTYGDEVYPRTLHIEDLIRYPKFIGFTRAAAERALIRYQKDPMACAFIARHALECKSLWPPMI